MGPTVNSGTNATEWRERGTHGTYPIIDTLGTHYFPTEFQLKH